MNASGEAQAAGSSAALTTRCLDLLGHTSGPLVSCLQREGIVLDQAAFANFADKQNHLEYIQIIAH